MGSNGNGVKWQGGMWQVSNDITGLEGWTEQENASDATVNAPARKIAIVLNAEDYGYEDEYITVEAAEDIKQPLKLCTQQACIPSTGEKIFYHTEREGCWVKNGANAVKCPTRQDCGICENTMNNIKSIIDKYLNLIPSAHAADQNPDDDPDDDDYTNGCQVDSCSSFPGGGAMNYEVIGTEYKNCCRNYEYAHGHCNLAAHVDPNIHGTLERVDHAYVCSKEPPAGWSDKVFWKFSGAPKKGNNKLIGDTDAVNAFKGKCGGYSETSGCSPCFPKHTKYFCDGRHCWHGVGVDNDLYPHPTYTGNVCSYAGNNCMAADSDGPDSYTTMKLQNQSTDKFCVQATETQKMMNYVGLKGVPADKYISINEFYKIVANPGHGASSHRTSLYKNMLQRSCKVGDRAVNPKVKYTSKGSFPAYTETSDDDGFGEYVYDDVLGTIPSMTFESIDLEFTGGNAVISRPLTFKNGAITAVNGTSFSITGASSTVSSSTIIADGKLTLAGTTVNNSPIEAHNGVEVKTVVLNDTDVDFCGSMRVVFGSSRFVASNENYIKEMENCSPATSETNFIVTKNGTSSEVFPADIDSQRYKYVVDNFKIRSGNAFAGCTSTNDLVEDDLLSNSFIGTGNNDLVVNDKMDLRGTILFNNMDIKTKYVLVGIDGEVQNLKLSSSSSAYPLFPGQCYLSAVQLCKYREIGQFQATTVNMTNGSKLEMTDAMGFFDIQAPAAIGNLASNSGQVLHLVSYTQGQGNDTVFGAIYAKVSLPYTSASGGSCNGLTLKYPKANGWGDAEFCEVNTDYTPEVLPNSLSTYGKCLFNAKGRQLRYSLYRYHAAQTASWRYWQASTDSQYVTTKIGCSSDKTTPCYKSVSGGGCSVFNNLDHYWMTSGLYTCDNSGSCQPKNIELMEDAPSWCPPGDSATWCNF